MYMAIMASVWMGTFLVHGSNFGWCCSWCH